MASPVFTKLLDGIMWNCLAELHQNSFEIRKTLVEINVRPEVKYDSQRVDFHGTQTCCKRTPIQNFMKIRPEPLFPIFRRVSKTAKSYYYHRHRLSVRIEPLGSHWTDFHQILY
jgi:hypothetical protein